MATQKKKLHARNVDNWEYRRLAVRRATALALVFALSPAAADGGDYEGSLTGAIAELFAFTSADSAEITLFLDPGREVGTGSVFLFDANDTLVTLFTGQALNGDVELVIPPARFTVVERGGSSGTLTLQLASFCAVSCKVIVAGAGDVDRIDYSFTGTDTSVLPLATGLRTFFSEGYQPSEGIAAGVSAQYSHADVQAFAHETLQIEGSPVFVGVVRTQIGPSFTSTGNMTVLTPDGEALSCYCVMGDLSGDRPGDYQLHWNRIEAGEQPDGLYLGVDVVLPP